MGDWGREEEGTMSKSAISGVLNPEQNFYSRMGWTEPFMYASLPDPPPPRARVWTRDGWDHPRGSTFPPSDMHTHKPQCPIQSCPTVPWDRQDYPRGFDLKRGNREGNVGN